MLTATERSWLRGMTAQDRVRELCKLWIVAASHHYDDEKTYGRNGAYQNEAAAGGRGSALRGAAMDISAVFDMDDLFGEAVDTHQEKG